MELKLQIRQTVVKDKIGREVYYTGTNPNDLTTNFGTLPSGRAWANYYNFIDITSDCSDIHKLKLTWTTERDKDGNLVIGGGNAKKSASGTLSIGGEAFRLIKSWLLNDVSSAVNSVDVQIEHVGAGLYQEYIIKSSDVRWCENDICQISVTLKQKDEAYKCIQNTLITDNHLGWFSPQPTKQHPRFSYCRKVSGATLQTEWYILNTIASTIFQVALPVALGYNMLLITVILPIVYFLNLLGANISTANLHPISLKDLFEPFGVFYVESAGCGREHPAPLIRDYIQNVCTKCNIEVDADSVPIFFAPTIDIETSDPNRPGTNNGYLTNYNNPHYNACYFNAPTKRGIRRYDNIGPLLPPFITPSLNTTDFYIPENGPVLALDQFLDQLKGLYNAHWRLVTYTKSNGSKATKLEFKRKDQFSKANNGYLYDFTTNGADRSKIIDGICLEWNGKKNPAVVTGLYNSDASNKIGDEVRTQANGQYIYDFTDVNPTFEGINDKSVDFGAAHFRLDGSSTDYIFDSLQVVVNAQPLQPFPNFSFNISQAADWFREFADYALLLDYETCSLPKVIIWDGRSYTNAKAYAPINLATTEPGINPRYNQSIFNVIQNWKSPVKHPVQNFVKGSGVNLGNYPSNYYTVNAALGLGVITQQPANLVNYPMYFEPGYYDTMWDWFHWIDDPKRKGTINQTWELKIPLCAEDLQKLGVFGDPANIMLGEMVKLPLQFNQDGQITEIEVSYDTSDENGMYIQLKGSV